MPEKRNIFKTTFYIVLLALVLTCISRPLVSIQQIDSTTGELVDAILVFEPKIEMVNALSNGLGFLIKICIWTLMMYFYHKMGTTNKTAY